MSKTNRTRRSPQAARSGEPRPAAGGAPGRAGDTRARGSVNRQLSQRQSQRRQLLGLLGLAAAFAVGVAAVLIILSLTGDDDSGGSNTAITAPSTTLNPSIPRDGRALGDPNAPVTVIEYGDYQCPFCANFGMRGLPQLADNYIASGQVRFEFRDRFVIDRDEDGESHRAAEAAMCAQDQGLFWDYHKVLYNNLTGENVGSFTPARLKELATLVPDMDRDAFNSCVDDRRHQEAVQAMDAESQGAGINSTPTFVVNGKVVQGSYEDVAAAIDAELANAQ